MKDRQATQEQKCTLADINDLTLLRKPERQREISWSSVEGITPYINFSQSLCHIVRVRSANKRDGARAFINSLLSSVEMRTWKWLMLCLRVLGGDRTRYVPESTFLLVLEQHSCYSVNQNSLRSKMDQSLASGLMNILLSLQDFCWG